MASAVHKQRAAAASPQKKVIPTIQKAAPTPEKAARKAQGTPEKPEAKKERVAFVRQEAEMTKEEWTKLQVGADEKWPQPEYMKEAGKGNHTCYRDETYIAITRWTSETKIAYRPHAKAPGSKSHARYEEYSKAKTVKEALELGSWPADWCWDYERGFLKAVGGKIREEPIDSSEVDLASLDEVDRILARWFVREAAKMLGMSLKDLQADVEAKDALLLRMKRTVAEKKAQEILARDGGAGITEEDVLAVLQSWGFRKNVTRQNVLPDGQTFVFSDTMGLVADRQGNINPTKYTLPYPSCQKVLCGFLSQNLPEDLKDFCFTSINVNKNYAGRRHRDGNNVGPSVIKAFGSYTGGNLNYYPNDNKALAVEELPESDRLSLDLSKNMVLFDGRRGHEVDPFEGERYTLVYFTCPRNERVDKEGAKGLKACGYVIPTEKQTEKCLKFLAPPQGYEGGASKAAPKGEQWRSWEPATRPTAAKATGVKRARK